MQEVIGSTPIFSTKESCRKAAFLFLQLIVRWRDVACTTRDAIPKHSISKGRILIPM
jgi:hypothetical protein